MKANFSIIVWLGITSSASALDFETCLTDLNSGKLRDLFNVSDDAVLGLDCSGSLCKPTDDTVATALSYLDCVAYCPRGNTPEYFSWNTLAQQFSSWLLPWVALMSQLPYGAARNRDNVMALVLTVGSPALAAYSLTLTALNTHYAASKFSTNPILTYPNAKTAATVLAGLQQLPLEIVVDNSLLASLVVLRQNDWWWKLVEALIASKYKWTTVNTSSMIWVVVAYFLSIIAAFLSLREISSDTDGPGLGSLWLWVRFLNISIEEKY